MSKLLIIEYIVAGGIRLWLSASDFKHAISDRVEISTPLNSWKRVTEGAALYHEGTDPYMGDMFHETPIGLLAFDWMLRNVPSWLTLIFITCDLLTAFLLCTAAKLFMKELGAKQEVEKSRYASNVESLMLRPLDLRMAPLYVASAYLFNPYTILNCAGLTTTVFANLSLAAVFLTMVQARRLLCCWFLALCTLQSLYPAMLIVPVCIYIARGTEYRRLSAMLTVACFAVTLSALLYASYHIAGSWNFLNSTYGFILNVPDLRPNIGLFWYFFTEMFEHFRLLFICAFQLNASALYLVPLSLRLHSEPMLLAASLSALTAVFKSYPSLGDVGFYLALLPMWKHLFHHMQQGFIVGCFFIVTSVLGPTVWHLWIYSRSANANFYFGVTLAFATAQIFLITDVLFAYIKREFALKHGLERTVKGKEAKLVLE